MPQISPSTTSGNNSCGRPAIETVEIFRGHNSFAVEIRQGVFWQGQYLKTTEACVTLPAGATPEWVREIAESIADEFALWQAGGRQ
jgi:hypothetical protein